jgi:hypothetical protein
MRPSQCPLTVLIAILGFALFAGACHEKQVAEPRPYSEGLNPSPGKEKIENMRYVMEKSRPWGSQKAVSGAVARFGRESTLPDTFPPHRSPLR